MSHWFLPIAMDDAALQEAIRDNALILAVEGMPDLSRIQIPDQIRAWLKQNQPDATPEHIAAQTEHYWRMARELLADDTIVLPLKAGNGFVVGEITGSSHKEAGRQIWPVKWLNTGMPAEEALALQSYMACSGMTEISDENALKPLAAYVPALRKQNTKIFRWIAIGTLIFELIYFWPSGK